MIPCGQDLRELVLMEDFKKCLSEHIVVYLNEQKVSKLSSAAVLADEFVLSHRTVFSLGVLRKSHANLQLAKHLLRELARRKRIGSLFIAISLGISSRTA